MPKKKKYIPRDQDKKWLEMVIHITKDGGTWGWPDAQISYQFNKTKKVATITSGDTSSYDAYVAGEVFKSIGWTVQGMGTER